MSLRWFPGLIVPILSSLLVLTSPVGTGQGIHDNELLHPVFSHVHLVDGRIVSDAQLAAARAATTTDSVSSRPPVGPAVGAGSGADALGLGVGLGPTLLMTEFTLPEAPDGRLLVSVSNLPTEFREAPQDPPPNTFA